MYINETERLEALAYKAKIKARAKRRRISKTPAASADGLNPGQKPRQPALYSLNLTIDEILEAGFTEEEFFRRNRYVTKSSKWAPENSSSKEQFERLSGKVSTRINHEGFGSCSAASYYPPLSNVRKFLMQLIIHGHYHRRPLSYKTTLAMTRSQGILLWSTSVLNAIFRSSHPTRSPSRTSSSL